MTEFDQLKDLLLITLSQNLNPSVRKISSPACQAESTRQVYDLSPEEDPLDCTADGYSGSGVQRIVRFFDGGTVIGLVRT